MNHLKNYKLLIDRSLIRILGHYQKSLSSVNAWGGDAVKRLIPFVTSGKTIRGSLVLFSYELFRKKASPEIIDVAATLELLHAGLLVHDDIMDRDRLRRGNTSIYTQYQEYFEKRNVKDAAHLGISLGICVGDLGFFLAFSLLGSLDISPEISTAIITKVAQELSLVGIAQMKDVDPSPRTESEILSLYTYKTARYTFSLPLAIGGILAKQSATTIKLLETLGEHQGILFQIVDDELNLFGDPKTTGKPVGSDLREHKQTLYYYYAKKLLPKDAWKELENIASGNMSVDQLIGIKTMFETYGIMDKVSKKKRELVQLIEKDIGSLHVTKNKKDQFHHLSSLLLSRAK